MVVMNTYTLLCIFLLPAHVDANTGYVPVPELLLLERIQSTCHVPCPVSFFHSNPRNHSEVTCHVLCPVSLFFTGAMTRRMTPRGP